MCEVRLNIEVNFIDFLLFFCQLNQIYKVVWDRARHLDLISFRQYFHPTTATILNCLSNTGTNRWMHFVVVHRKSLTLWHFVRCSSTRSTIFWWNCEKLSIKMWCRWRCINAKSYMSTFSTTTKILAWQTRRHWNCTTTIWKWWSTNAKRVCAIPSICRVCANVSAFYYQW